MTQEIIVQRFASSQDLELLESELNEFNPFRILKIQEIEIRHSNFLAWILDPNQNHGLGDRVLKKVIIETLMQNPEKDFSFNPFLIKQMFFYDVEVRREWRNIDLLLISRHNKFLLLIENKVNAKESAGQLSKYLSSVEEEFKSYVVLPLFLTLTGENSSLNDFFIFSYSSIYGILKFTLNMYKQNINDKIVDFIHFYLRTLEVITMEDERLQKLCKQIYSKHKEAVDLIVSYASGSFNEATELFIGKHTELKGLHQGNKWLWFLPIKFMNSLPLVEAGWQVPYPICFWFRCNEEDKTLQLKIEVGPFLNSNLRADFLSYLKENGKDFFKIGKNLEKAISNPDAKYTRIWNKTEELDNSQNPNDITVKMDKLYSQAKPIIEELFLLVKDFKWKE